MKPRSVQSICCRNSNACLLMWGCWGDGHRPPGLGPLASTKNIRNWGVLKNRVHHILHLNSSKEAEMRL